MPTVHRTIYADGTPVNSHNCVVIDHVVSEFTITVRNASEKAITDHLQQWHEVVSIKPDKDNLFKLTLRSLTGVSENRLRELLAKRWTVIHCCRRTHTSVVRNPSPNVPGQFRTEALVRVA
jgi:hypothetical protein